MRRNTSSPWSEIVSEAFLKSSAFMSESTFREYQVISMPERYDNKRRKLKYRILIFGDSMEALNQSSMTNHTIKRITNASSIRKYVHWLTVRSAHFSTISLKGEQDLWAMGFFSFICSPIFVVAFKPWYETIF